MIRQEQSSLNPDLGELIPIPLYPSKQELTPKLTQDKQKGCKKYRRKVLLTTSSGESLVWTKNLTFVIDVGVERRKVSEGNQKHFVSKISSAKGLFQGRGKGIVQLRLMQTVFRGSRVFLFFHSTGSMIFLTYKLMEFK